MSISRGRAYLALTAVFAGVFVAADDQTVVVTVLPQIMLDLKLTVTELDHTSWIITGYLLGYVAAMPFIGRLSDIWGHRNTFIGSLLLFMLGSVGVALATDINWLIGLRVFQALGAGALVPIAIAIVGDLFPPESRGTPLGFVGASAEAGGVIGPLWGGIITKYLSWQWVFWLNLPLCAIIIALTLVLLPSSPRYPARMDYIGGALITLSLAALTLGLARMDDLDWLMALWLALALLSLALFIVRQRTAADPLLPRAMFRARAFVAANASHLLIGGALIIGMVTIPLMANTLLGESPLGGGLMLLRMTVAIPFGAVLGGIVCQRYDYRLPAALGLLLAALGFWLMSGWGSGHRGPVAHGPPCDCWIRLRAAHRANRACRHELRRRRCARGRSRADNHHARRRNDAGSRSAYSVGNRQVRRADCGAESPVRPAGRDGRAGAGTNRRRAATTHGRGVDAVQRLLRGSGSAVSGGSAAGGIHGVEGEIGWNSGISGSGDLRLMPY